MFWVAVALHLFVMIAAVGGTHKNVHKSQVVLCSDYDKSMTTSDTTNFVVDEAIAAHHSPENARKIWEELSNYYMTQREHVMKKHLNIPVDSSNNAVSMIMDFLADFAAMDLKSIQRVIQSKILEGMTIHHLKQAAQRSASKLYSHMSSVLKRVHGAHIVSSNWSKRMILFSLEAADAVPTNLQIHGNGNRWPFIFEAF